MFFDWLDAYQDFPAQLPLVGRDGFIRIDTVTGETSTAIKCPTYRHEGSYSTSLAVRVSGNRLYVSGNPSRFDRLDNLFGFTSLDDCFSVLNRVLVSLGLPAFSKCTRTWFLQAEEGGKHSRCTDGVVITRLDVTSNKAVGQGNESAYLRALAGLSYRHSVPRLHTNGCTVDWLSKRGKASLIYPTAYDKAHEIGLHSLPQIKRLFGRESAEFKYLSDVQDYCRLHGVVRMEQKFKSEMLRRESLNYWGLSDFSAFAPLHLEFLNLDRKLQVTAMSLEHIAEKLLRTGICLTTHSANSTAVYALKWMHGASFDFNKSQVQTHRARLRKIGIDIALPCDLSTFSPVSIREVREVEVRELVAPTWYQKATVYPMLRAA